MSIPFLAHFTPSLMKPEDLEALLVQREPLAQHLVELIRESALTPSKHHTLLIGPRGIGKTHLIALIYYRIQKQEDLRDRLWIAWLREEEWGVGSFLDLLLRIFRALQAEYPDAISGERIEALYKLTADAAEHAAAMMLKEFVADRALLLLVENLDTLFAGLGDKGQKRLRSYIQENPFFTILATSQSLFNDVALQKSPFYGFFRQHHLDEFSLEEATLLLTKIADFRNDSDLVAFIQTPTGRARIRAVHHLAGGNPRVYVIFSQFLTREALDKLVEPFLSTLDELTPYYQARMSWLSNQQRKIVEFLCERRGAAPVKEIAQRGFMTQQTASGQLQDLRNKGYVQSTAIGRDSYYELREPLMRMCIEVKKHRGEPIFLFVDFLRLWYALDELQQLLASCHPDAILEREYLLRAIQRTEQESEDPRAAACLKDYIAYFEQGDFIHALQAAEELVAIRGDGRDWFELGGCLMMLGRIDEALIASNREIELTPDNAGSWCRRGYLLDQSGCHDEALSSYDKAYSIGWPFIGDFFNRAIILLLQDWKEGCAALEAALYRFAQEEERVVSHTRQIVQNMLVSPLGAAMWKTQIADLIALYDKYRIVSAIGLGLVRSIGTIILPTTHEAVTELWRRTWHELVDGRKEFEIPLRLLDAATHYRITGDPRLLLELPVEERTLLEPVLKIVNQEEAGSEGRMG
jgi:tetratricopeptide (TPR) repeat protein